METTKHTNYWAEKLASEFAPINDMPCGTRMTRAYKEGYLKAIEETAAKEVLGTLHFLLNAFSIGELHKHSSPEKDICIDIIKKAIKKASQ